MKGEVVAQLRHGCLLIIRAAVTEFRSVSYQQNGCSVTAVAGVHIIRKRNRDHLEHSAGRFRSVSPHSPALAAHSPGRGQRRQPPDFRKQRGLGRLPGTFSGIVWLVALG
jgi:hypothetical protein